MNQRPAMAAYYGYRPGMRSPCGVLTLSLPPVGLAFDRPRLDALDRTLAAAFGLALPYPADRLPDDPAQPDLAIAGRVLWLGAALIEALGLPIFEIPRVIGSRHDEHGLHVQALVPMLDGVSEQISQHAIAAARLAVASVAAAADDVAAARAVCERLYENLFETFDQRTTVGTSTPGGIRAALARDIPVRHLQQHLYQLGWGASSRLMNGAASDAEPTFGSMLAHNKQSAAGLLRRAGLPTAEHILVDSADKAVEAAARLGWPVVVKPVDRDRGEGVVAGIRTPDALLMAYHAARALSGSVLVERHVPGICHRLFVIDGRRLQFVAKRLPKGVHGNGAHTVAELIAEANRLEQEKPPWKRLKPFPTDDLARTALAAAGLTFESVPAVGQFAPLRDIQSVAQGGVTDDFTDRVHPDNASLACQAARVFRLTAAGIDLITVDITRSWREVGGIVNEVNFAPFLGELDQARAATDVLLAHLVKGDGRIPVAVFVGGAEAFAAARRRLATAPAGHVLSSHDVTLDAPDRERPLAARGLFARCLALLADPGVTGLIVVVQTDEWLSTGLPVDRLTSVEVFPEKIADWQAPQTATTPPREAGLLAMLKAFTLRRSSVPSA